MRTLCFVSASAMLAVTATLVAGIDHAPARLRVQDALAELRQDGPPRILVLADHSASQTYVIFGRPSVLARMRSRTKVERLAEALVDKLPAGAALRIASFSDAFRASPRWVTTREDVLDAFRAVEQPFGASAIWDAVHQAAALLDGAEGRRYMLLFSDGKASANVIGFEAAVARVVAANVTVHTVNVNDAAFRRREDLFADPVERLRRLAAATGGEHREAQPQRLPETAGELVRHTAARASGR
jgi:hypothetical protein